MNDSKDGFCFEAQQRSLLFSTTGEGFYCLEWDFKQKRVFFFGSAKAREELFVERNSGGHFLFQKNKEVMGAIEQEYEGKCV